MLRKHSDLMRLLEVEFKIIRIWRIPWNPEEAGTGAGKLI